MLVKTSELSGAALDWAVAKCVGNKWVWYTHEGIPMERSDDEVEGKWKPTTNWAQGGPIIEREEIGIRRNAPCSGGRQWEACPSITAKGAGGKYGYGPTPLTAAMRCYVASKLGTEMEVPDEIL